MSLQKRTHTFTPMGVIARARYAGHVEVRSNMQKARINLKVLQPCPTVPGAQLQPNKVCQKDLLTKQAVFQAPRSNRSNIWIGDDPQTLAQKEGILLPPGEKFEIDIDTNRFVGFDIGSVWFAGDYAGDKLVVAYLQEEDSAGD
jgi:hypothetical protein